MTMIRCLSELVTKPTQTLEYGTCTHVNASYEQGFVFRGYLCRLRSIGCQGLEKCGGSQDDQSC
eukprot:scaffold3224_cov158-Amphora_coffeaeformis.AAC.14